MSYKLICFDMDGVLFQDINFWLELHKKFGTLEQGKVLTEKYLHSDYERLIEEVVVKLWKGRDATPYFELVNSLKYVEGVPKVLGAIKRKGLITAIISDLCKDLDISASEVIYIGDSDTNIEAFKEVGLSIAFNCASEELKRVATHVVEGKNLEEVLKHLP